MGKIAYIFGAVEGFASSQRSLTVRSAHNGKLINGWFFNSLLDHDGPLIPLRNQLVAQAFQPVRAQAKACGYR